MTVTAYDADTLFGSDYITSLAPLVTATTLPVTAGPIDDMSAGGGVSALVFQNDDAVSYNTFTVRFRFNSPDAYTSSGRDSLTLETGSLGAAIIMSVFDTHAETDYYTTPVDLTAASLTSYTNPAGSNLEATIASSKSVALTVPTGYSPPSGLYDIAVTVTFAATTTPSVVFVVSHGSGAPMDVLSWSHAFVEPDPDPDPDPDPGGGDADVVDDRYGLGLAVEFGFDATGPNDPDFTWTPRRDARVSDGIRIARGRTADSPTIPTGTLALSLDDVDGRYTTGTYGTVLKVGTPVRVRATAVGDDGLFDDDLFDPDLFGGAAGTQTATIWRGFVDARPAEIRNTVDQVVRVEGIDVIGLAARTVGPLSAWDHHIRTLTTPPVVWWRPGPDGWIDQQSGTRARHNSLLIETDPLTAGEQPTWQSSELGEGRGASDIGPFIEHDTAGEPFLLSMWVRLASEPAELDHIVLFQQLSTNGERHLEVTVNRATGRLYVVLARTTDVDTFMNIGTVPMDLFDDEAHHLMVWGGYDVDVDGFTLAEHIRLFIDGRRFTMFSQLSDNSYPTSTPSRLHLAGGVRAATFLGGTPPLVQNAHGTVDHVMWWHNWTDLTTVQPFAVELTQIGRTGWARDLLHDRLERILDAVNLAEMTGDLDTSNVRAVGPYMTGDLSTLLQQIEDSELGRVWVDHDGMVRFAARGWAWTSREAVEVQAWFSDDLTVDPSCVPMIPGSLTFSDDPRTISNVADVTREGGRSQHAEDADSVTTYGRRNPRSLAGLLFGSDIEAANLARWLVYQGAAPSKRVTGLAFNCVKHPGLAGPALNLDEGHLVKITHRGVTYLGHVAGRTDDIADQWIVTLAVDSSRAGLNLFRAGVDQVGDTSRIVGL